MIDNPGGHIVFTIDNPLPFAGGGAGKFALKLARSLVARGYRISVVTPQRGAWGDQKILDKNVAIHQIAVPVSRPEALFSLIYNLRLGAFLWRRRSDLHGINLRGLRGILTAVLFGRLLGKKVYITALSENNWRLIYPQPSPSFYRWIIKKAIRGVERLIAQSRRIQERMTSDGFPPDQISYIPNGTAVPDDTGDKTRQRLRLQIPPEKFVVLFVGRLHWQKDVFFLLEGWRAFGAGRRDSRLIILGDGPQRKQVRQFLVAHGLQENVDVRGYVDNVEEYLTAADIFVLPSRMEGCSNALLEAMAHGLACIATDSPGNDEIIRHAADGWLIRPGDVQDLTDSINKLKDDISLRQVLGRAARQTIRNRFSMEATTEAHIRLYRREAQSSFQIPSRHCHASV